MPTSVTLKGNPVTVRGTEVKAGEHAPDFEGALDELISLIHRVAIAQIAPEAIDNSWGDAQRVGQIAGSITAEDAQLFYQIALNGKRDIALAPDPRSGFEMILLRMLAFRPDGSAAENEPGRDTQPESASKVPARSAAPELPTHEFMR